MPENTAVPKVVIDHADVKEPVPNVPDKQLEVKKADKVTLYADSTKLPNSSARLTTGCVGQTANTFWGPPGCIENDTKEGFAGVTERVEIEQEDDIDKYEAFT